MPASQAGLPVVVALGAVDPALVSDVLDGHCRFAATPDDAVLAVAAGVIVRADARVDKALLRRALHLPLTAQTRHTVDGAFLAQVRPGAVLINCGRGALIDTDAVLRALNDGRLSGVGLDVFDPEPPDGHPLLSHPDVVLTPHLMGLSRRAAAATFKAAAQGILDVLAGREPQAVANPGWLISGPARQKEIPA
jgi:phosphoglycerate dehydrogenase-like enzyme